MLIIVIQKKWQAERQKRDRSALFDPLLPIAQLAATDKHGAIAVPVLQTRKQRNCMRFH